MPPGDQENTRPPGDALPDEIFGSKDLLNKIINTNNLNIEVIDVISSINKTSTIWKMGLELHCHNEASNNVKERPYIPSQ